MSSPSAVTSSALTLALLLLSPDGILSAQVSRVPSLRRSQLPPFLSVSCVSCPPVTSPLNARSWRIVGPSVTEPKDHRWEGLILGGVVLAVAAGVTVDRLCAGTDDGCASQAPVVAGAAGLAVGGLVGWLIGKGIPKSPDVRSVAPSPPN